MPPTQSKPGSLRALIPLLIGLGGTFACAPRIASIAPQIAPRTVTTDHGFVVLEEHQAAVELTWNTVADIASRTYGELAMLHFAARQIGFLVSFAAGEKVVFAHGLISVPATECIADSALLDVFAGFSSNILGRDVMVASTLARQTLLPLCDEADSP